MARLFNNFILLVNPRGRSWVPEIAARALVNENGQYLQTDGGDVLITE
jgi:hypothetical protein